MAYSFAFMEQYMLGIGRPFTSNFKSHLLPLIMRITCLLKKNFKILLFMKIRSKVFASLGFQDRNTGDQ